MHPLDFVESSRPSVLMSDCNAFFTMTSTKTAPRQIQDVYFSMFLVRAEDQPNWVLLDLGYYFNKKDGMMMNMGIIAKKNAFDFNDILLSVGRLYNNQNDDRRDEKNRPPRWEEWFVRLSHAAGQPLDQLSMDDIEQVFLAHLSKKSLVEGVSSPALGSMTVKKPSKL